MQYCTSPKASLPISLYIINSLAIEVIESGKERITDEAIEKWGRNSTPKQRSHEDELMLTAIAGKAGCERLFVFPCDIDAASGSCCQPVFHQSETSALGANFLTAER
jgi:hypothetical protein